MIVILLISLKRELGGGGFFSSLKRQSGGGGGGVGVFSFQKDNRIHVYRNIVNSDQEDFLIFVKKNACFRRNFRAHFSQFP